MFSTNYSFLTCREVGTHQTMTFLRSLPDWSSNNNMVIEYSDSDCRYCICFVLRNFHLLTKGNFKFKSLQWALLACVASRPRISFFNWRQHHCHVLALGVVLAKYITLLNPSIWSLVPRMPSVFHFPYSSVIVTPPNRLLLEHPQMSQPPPFSVGPAIEARSLIAAIWSRPSRDAASTTNHTIHRFRRKSRLRSWVEKNWLLIEKISIFEMYI